MQSFPSFKQIQLRSVYFTKQAFIYQYIRSIYKVLEIDCSITMKKTIDDFAIN